MAQGPQPQNRLDRALGRLEKHVANSSHSVRHLREAIAWLRSKKALDEAREARVIREVSALESRAEVTTQDIENLVTMLMQEGA